MTSGSAGRPRVAVIVPNWNGRHHLDACLRSLSRQTYPNVEIVLVDNASTDGSVEFVHTTFPDVRMLVQPRNVGFAGALNAGIAATSGNYVATLNNDASADPDWLAELVAAIELAATVGAVASKMLFARQPNIVNSAGICLDRAGIAWDRLGGTPDDPAELRPSEVFGASGGAALYRRAMLDDIGAFEPTFFAYLEDVDLAWRARLRGWRTLYVPTARVLHEHSATAVEGSPFKSYHLARNKTWLLLRCCPARQLLRDLPWIVGYDLAFLIWALLTRRDLATLRGRLDAWRALPRVLAARRRIQSRRTVSATQARALLAPLAWPWRVLARYRHLSVNPS